MLFQQPCALKYLNNNTYAVVKMFIYIRYLYVLG